MSLQRWRWKAGWREHVQDVLVVGEQREFSTCGEYVRKASALATIAYLSRSGVVQRDEGPRNELDTKATGE